MSGHHPPMLSGGLPILGHMLEFTRDRDSLFERGYREHGDVFAMSLAGKKFAVVSGAHNNQRFYGETDKALSMDEAYAMLRAAFGEVLFTAGPELYYNQRPALQALFRHERMVSYVDAMRIEVQAWLDSLGTAGEVNISAAMFSLAQAIAGRAFVGPDFREELGQAFWRDYEAISRSIDPILPPDLPLPKFVRRDRAKQRMRALMGPIIARRRAHPDRFDDVITQLITTPLKDGSFMTDEELVTLFIGLLFAGHETTAGQAGWLIVLLLQHPDYLRLVQGEIAEHVTTDMDPRALSKLRHIYWAIDETTRLRPSADMQMRMVKAPVQLDRYVVPEGWGMCVNAAVTHHLEDVYTQPEAFDPLRFSPERDEGRGTFDSVGFGGGIHKCTGMNFAKNEMAVITMLLFGQFDLELITPQVEIVRGLGANRPSEAIVRYKRK